MSKQKLISEVQRAGGAMASPGVASQAVDAVMDAVERITRSGDKVQIRGFGSFQMKDRAARSGRNPRTGERMEIAGRRVLTFTDRRNK